MIENSSNTENILGYVITTKSVDECISEISAWIAADDIGRYFVCANPHSLVVANADPKFRKAIVDADLVTPDGSGIVLASGVLNGQIASRITGNDVFIGISEELNKTSEASYFFLGSSDKVLGDIRAKIAVDYPNIRVAGTWSPPFKADFSEEDNELMIAAINAAKPDVLWVGMTAPKQEKWIHQHLDRLDVKLLVQSAQYSTSILGTLNARMQYSKNSVLSGYHDYSVSRENSGAETLFPAQSFYGWFSSRDFRLRHRTMLEYGPQNHSRHLGNIKEIDESVNYRNHRPGWVVPH